jgi:hypothetical protein
MPQPEPEPDPRPRPTQTQDRRKDCFDGTLPNEPIYWPTDSQGRAQGAEVCLRFHPDMGEKKTCTPNGMRNHLVSSTWDKGHLIGYSLGGNGLATDGRGCTNIAGQSVQTNVNVKNLEQAVLKRLDTGETIYYRVEVQYEGNKIIPYELSVLIVGLNDGKVNPTVFTQSAWR